MTGAVAVVAGATGLVGQELVRQLAADGGWREVRALVRRALPAALAGPPVTAVQVDYGRLEPSPRWAAGDHVFCALGTTMAQAGSPEAFRQVDLDFPLALARASLSQGARHFLLVSALGADSGSRLFYNRVKGEVEAGIAALGYRSVTIARPSLLLGHRRVPRLGERVAGVLGVLAPPRWRPVPAARVARALVEAAKRDEPGVHILKNPELRRAVDR